MADNTFFDLLKSKMDALKTTETHREGDWSALNEKLTVALPQQSPTRRRAIVLPLLLFAALLSSNAAWWRAKRSDQSEKTRLEAQVSQLQATIAAVKAVPQVVVHIDTVWQTVYVQHGIDSKKSVGTLDDIKFNPSPFQLQLPESSKLSGSSMPEAAEQVAPFFKAPAQAAAPENQADSIQQMSDLQNLKLPALALLEIPKNPNSSPLYPVNPVNPVKKTTEPYGQKLLKALSPKFFKIGVSAGWIYANSAELMHEGGFSCNMRGQIGLTRHWSLTAGFSMGMMHYKSHIPEAILGAPGLPVLPSMDHHFAEMDVTGQKFRQFDLGLRYTFAHLGKPRPFLGLGWGRQTLLPFTIEYEIQHEPSGAIQKAAFEVAAQTKLRNILGLNTGIELPLSPRLDLNLEGFYQRQWKKPNRKAPDLTGIRAGLNWLF